MIQRELTLLNLGQSLDDIANIDPRGYGVCKILYRASREYTGKPISMNAAQKLVETVKENDYVFILTGFVLDIFKKAEMDGIIGSMLLCRALVKALGAKPVIICPEDNYFAVENMANCIGLHIFDDLDELREVPFSMGVVCFTKDSERAEEQADKIIDKVMPSAVVSIECPGANINGVYHNAAGCNVSVLEAKQDILFEKLQKLGVLNISIGDLGNEIGMGAIEHTLKKYIPYAGTGQCVCGCGGGIAAKTKADNIITSTISDWGCYALIAAMSYLVNDIDVMHTAEMEKQIVEKASDCGMIDMYGWLVPAIDGIGLEINMPIVALMREIVKSTMNLRETCKPLFEKINELGFFEVCKV